MSILDLVYIGTFMYFVVLWVLSKLPFSLYYVMWAVFVFCGILILSDLLALPVAITRLPSRARSLRVLLIPGIISHAMIFILLIIEFIHVQTKIRGLPWDIIFPHLSWHVLTGTIVYLFYKKVASRSHVDENVSYRELMEQS